MFFKDNPGRVILIQFGIITFSILISPLFMFTSKDFNQDTGECGIYAIGTLAYNLLWVLPILVFTALAISLIIGLIVGIKYESTKVMGSNFLIFILMMIEGVFLMKIWL